MNPDLLYGASQDYFSRGEYKDAILSLALLRGNDSYRVRALTNISSCLLMMGLARPAHKFIDRALKCNPDFVPANINRVKAFLLQEMHQEIDILCNELVIRYPNEDEIWDLWIKSLRCEHRDDRALEVVHEWLRHSSENKDGLLLEAELLSNQGDHYLALKSLGKTLELYPGLETAYSHLTVVLIRLSKFDEALRYAEKLISINPDRLHYICCYATSLWATGAWRDAENYFSKAAAIKPKSANYLLQQYLLLPPVPNDRIDIEEARGRFLEGIALAESRHDLELSFFDESMPHTFTLAYHNANDRILLERYIELMRSLCKPYLDQVSEFRKDLDQQQSKRVTGKIRIGFISQFFNGHSNAIAFSGLIRNLDRNFFDVVLIHTASSKRDDVRDSLDLVCQDSLQLPSDYVQAGMKLVSLKLDILFYTDIGMSANEFFLPLVKAAPIQMTGWGIPHTSGIKEIDFYISARDLEPSDAQEHYTEQLVKLPLGLPCCFETDAMDHLTLPREYFFLPPGDTLIGCLQGLHKLHPDFDLILEDIARQNPNVGFVFVEDRLESISSSFFHRLSVRAPLVSQRCIPLAMMGRSEYRALCNCIDILLDPIYYGCGITFFEATYVGTPIVTLEGSNLRTRVVSCGYREMGVDGPPIASNVKEYVQIVTSLATSASKRSKLKADILSKNRLVFDRLDFVRHFEDFCHEVS
jgi:protein O-GlcNAc transferase